MKANPKGKGKVQAEDMDYDGDVIMLTLMLPRRKPKRMKRTTRFSWLLALGQSILYIEIILVVLKSLLPKLHD